MSSFKDEILEILCDDARTTPEQMAVMLGATVEEVKAGIQELEDAHIIVKYSTRVNRDKAFEDTVEALIEVKVTPQRQQGFDTIARRIYRFEEVRSVYLMSGTYDLMVLVEGCNMRQVAFFVAEKLSTIDGVISTATHFVLKRYKDDGVIMDDDTDERLVVAP